jgi:CMP-N-acetylneuraminic acid synthetase
MPEPLIILTGISTLLSNSIKLGNDIGSTLSGIKNAPHHIAAIKDDLEDFCSTLGTSSMSSTVMIIPAIESLQFDAFDTLTRIIEHRVAVFKKFRTIVNNFVSLSGDAKKSP